MGEILTHLLGTYGYVLVALLVFAEGVGLPLPGETALLTAAAFAAHHQLSLVGVIIAAAAGGILGGTGGYWLGRTGGLAVLRRHGRWFGVTERRLARARTLFEAHGAKTVFASRFIALLRMLAGILAGVSRMRFDVFTLYNALGAIAWAIVFGALGYVFGNNLPWLEHVVGRVSLIALGVIVMAVVVILRLRRERTPEG